jgi:hypothetical protein
MGTLPEILFALNNWENVRLVTGWERSAGAGEDSYFSEALGKSVEEYILILNT